MTQATERIHPVVLAGGGGTRLWPLSRQLYPKQFFPLLGEQSLLRDTLDRVGDHQRFAAPIVVCNEEHRFLVAEQLRAGGVSGEIVLEPYARNTAPAACIAALHLVEQEPEAVMLMLPSDHAITRPDAFTDSLAQAEAAARAGWLVTLGVAPSRAETGYGYIRLGGELPDVPGCAHVKHFVEKPDKATAESYLANGNYLWNSGMFLMSARTLLDEIEGLRPEILDSCQAALAGAARDLDFLRLDAAAFEANPGISLDYAVMERTARAAVVSMDAGWSDVGSWQSLWEVLEKDDAGNAIAGDVVAMGTRGCLLRGDDRLLAALGVSDLVVVATDDAVLVCPRERAQDVGGLVAELKQRARPETQTHSRIYRPWGSYRDVDLGPNFKVKRLTVAPGRRLSLQRHRHRTEHWVVVHGQAAVTCEGRTLRLGPNESTYIPRGAAHRLANPGSEPLHVIEVQSGDHLHEDDIERLDDAYGRT
ncbi:mannose-1-phosphate guanylyltransferase/mannose-6-phosphate isomerase [Ferruginivarius sediminum]|uniref:mannose-1-phosphate guanylyltransferase n=1 Tax=Ferruginivarius sediminum TaxID=2661937 RepID=A0A369TGE0_9PROT|nr:mannose-1-phosphate guanylyltransferase/mannose-6-phosphate isomerase [Ferruginivarius sediminum]RDD63664.1 mannose-1-phosphate guanylyltransferase/mannose-6-phosphate isomerase [Ferruginivarius sediminum]